MPFKDPKTGKEYKDFADCVSQNKWADSPEAYCAYAHEADTGKWPSEEDSKLRGQGYTEMVLQASTMIDKIRSSKQSHKAQPEDEPVIKYIKELLDGKASFTEVVSKVGENYPNVDKEKVLKWISSLQMREVASKKRFNATDCWDFVKENYLEGDTVWEQAFPSKDFGRKGHVLLLRGNTVMERVGNNGPENVMDKTAYLEKLNEEVDSDLSWSDWFKKVDIPTKETSGGRILTIDYEGYHEGFYYQILEDENGKWWYNVADTSGVVNEGGPYESKEEAIREAKEEAENAKDILNASKEKAETSGKLATPPSVGDRVKIKKGILTSIDVPEGMLGRTGIVRKVNRTLEGYIFTVEMDNGETLTVNWGHLEKASQTATRVVEDLTQKEFDEIYYSAKRGFENGEGMESIVKSLVSSFDIDEESARDIVEEAKKNAENSSRTTLQKATIDVGTEVWLKPDVRDGKEERGKIILRTADAVGNPIYEVELFPTGRTKYFVEDDFEKASKEKASEDYRGATYNLTQETESGKWWATIIWPDGTSEEQDFQSEEEAEQWALSEIDQYAESWEESEKAEMVYYGGKDFTFSDKVFETLSKLSQDLYDIMSFEDLSDEQKTEVLYKFIETTPDVDQGFIEMIEDYKALKYASKIPEAVGEQTQMETINKLKESYEAMPNTNMIIRGRDGIWCLYDNNGDKAFEDEDLEVVKREAETRSISYTVRGE